MTVKAKSNAVVWFIPKEQLVKKDAPKEENVKLAQRMTEERKAVL